MGNKQSGNAAPYASHDFQIVSLTKQESNGSKNNYEKPGVYDIFHYSINKDTDIISKPLTDISTSEYNAAFQIAISKKEEKNTIHKDNMEDNMEKKMEDRVYTKEFEKGEDKIFIASVLDGHEGIKIRDSVIENLFDLIATKLFENPENIEGVIKEAFQTVDSQLCEDMAKELETILSPKKYCFPCLNHDSKKVQKDLHIGCGCVLTLLCIHNNSLILAGLGDCGICFSIGGKSCFSLVRHNPSNELERQRIESAGGKISNNRINGSLGVSRSFGDVYFKPSYHKTKLDTMTCSQDIVIAEPEVEIRPLSNDIEFCIIGSDGVFSAISYQEAINIVKRSILNGRSGDDACQEIINKCRKITNDDISIIILFFHIDHHSKCHNTIESNIISRSRCYSNRIIDMNEEEDKEDPDISSSVYHSLSEANLTINTTRQSYRDPFQIGLCDMFHHDEETATSRVSLDCSSLHSSKE